MKSFLPIGGLWLIVLGVAGTAMAADSRSQRDLPPAPPQARTQTAAQRQTAQTAATAPRRPQTTAASTTRPQMAAAATTRAQSTAARTPTSAAATTRPQPAAASRPRSNTGVAPTRYTQQSNGYYDGPTNGEIVESGETIVYEGSPRQGGFAADGFGDGGGWSSPDVYSGGCGPHCGPSCTTCYAPCWVMPCWYVGFDFTVLMPRFGNNPAFTNTRTDNVSFLDSEEQSFTYDMKFGPRVWLGFSWDGGVGMRVQWWQFDHSSDVLTRSPDADGFSTLSGPFEVAGVMLPQTSLPGDVYATQSRLKAYVIDWEATKGIDFGNWSMMLGGGIRHGSVSQSDGATITGPGGVLRSVTENSHRFDGAGPTFSLQARRPLMGYWSIFTMVRGSLLYGSATSSLVIQDDLDLQQSFLITSRTDRNSLLPIAESQFGLEYSAYWTGLALFGRAVVEGQLWQGAGSASNQDSNLGFIGVTGSVGLDF